MKFSLKSQTGSLVVVVPTCGISFSAVDAELTIDNYQNSTQSSLYALNLMFTGDEGNCRQNTLKRNQDEVCLTDGRQGCALHMPSRSLSFHLQEYLLNIGMDWMNTPIWMVNLKEEEHWNTPKPTNDFLGVPCKERHRSPRVTLARASNTAEQDSYLHHHVHLMINKCS